MAHSKEQDKSAKVILEETRILHFLDKDFKTTILSILKSQEENMDKELKEIRKTLYEQTENINKDIKITKRNQR